MSWLRMPYPAVSPGVAGRLANSTRYLDIEIKTDQQRTHATHIIQNGRVYDSSHRQPLFCREWITPGDTVKPKPDVDVMGKPIVDHILDTFSIRVRDLTLNLHKAHILEDYPAKSGFDFLSSRNLFIPGEVS